MDCRTVTDKREFSRLLDQAADADVLGIDCEADVKLIKKPNGKSAIDPATFSVVGGSLYIHGQATAYYFPFSHRAGGNLPDGCLDLWLEFMARELLGAADGRRRWVHNMHAEIQMLANHGYLGDGDEPLGTYDSMIAAWLLGYGGERDEDDASGFEALGLKDLRTRVLALPSRKEFDDISRGRQTSDIEVGEISTYAALDAYDTAMIGETLWPRLVKHGMAEHMVELDIPMAEICREMEAEGWDIDVASIEELNRTLVREASAIADEFRALTTTLVIDMEDLPQQIGLYKNGKPKFKKMPTDVVKARGGDVSNDRDCARFIFREMRALPLKGAVLNKDGTPSLKKENIEKYLASHADKLGGKLVQLRFDYKMRSTLTNVFVKPLTMMPPQYQDGRIHPSFNVTGTSTQRLSSSNPNGQNLPARTEYGKRIRKAFRAPDPEWRVGCFDMSQAELRVAAHFSGDPELVTCYTSDPEIDVHAGTLAKLHELGFTTAVRSDAKIVNFSSFYRITPPKLAIKMKAPLETAEIAWEAHHSRFRVYWEWEESVLEFVKEHGYVVTIDGFKRRLDNTLSFDKFTRKMDLHWSVKNQCANTVIQGSVAGWAKKAMIEAKREFMCKGMWGSVVRFRAQEHDSVVPVALASATSEVEEILVRHMTTAFPLRVPMKVDGGWGMSWGEAKK